MISFFSIILFLYLLFSILIYSFQEKIIFYPQKLPKDFSFGYYRNFEERFVEMKDGKELHALLFRAKEPKGVVFYLHGNAGSLEGWGSVADTFVNLGYDVFIPDYRSYGKSEGSIKSESQLYEDMQRLYDVVKEEYSEEEIIVLGHSIGSGMAAKLAATNNPKLLILQAPPYSLPDLAKNINLFKIFPSFLLRYKFETGKYLAATDVPVVVLHGDEDEIVYYGSALKLQERFKLEDKLITLEGFGHNNFIDTKEYREEIRKILQKY